MYIQYRIYQAVLVLMLCALFATPAPAALQAIGHDGVYYGFKLGKTIPWVNGWPFDTVSHPQYVGSVLTVWALVALVWGQAPHAALAIMSGFWTLVYVVTAVQEQYL
jgi:methylene-fatty-acyl-phospholipid synthase